VELDGAAVVLLPDSLYEPKVRRRGLRLRTRVPDTAPEQRESVGHVTSSAGTTRVMLTSWEGASSDHHGFLCEP